MCFYNDDYDWTAAVCEEDKRTASKPVRCMECRRLIPVGGAVVHVFLRQHEACKNCDEELREEWDDDYEGGPLTPCADGKHDYGETYDYDRCEDCDQFLQAVQTAELEAGCRLNESRPPLEFMVEYIAEAGIEEARKYFKKARDLFPCLKESGFLGWLWRKMFNHVLRYK